GGGGRRGLERVGGGLGGGDGELGRCGRRVGGAGRGRWPAGGRHRRRNEHRHQGHHDDEHPFHGLILRPVRRSLPLAASPSGATVSSSAVSSSAVSSSAVSRTSISAGVRVVSVRAAGGERRRRRRRSASSVSWASRIRRRISCRHIPPTSGCISGLPLSTAASDAKDGTGNEVSTSAPSPGKIRER